MSELGIPVNFEKSNISINLNAFIFEIFLTGMYTMIYFGTMYIYFTRNSPNRRLVPATITIIFLAIIVQTGSNWYITKWQFVDNDETRDSVFIALVNIPEWAPLVVTIPPYLSFILADGLLMWRCYFVWNRSLHIISVPLLLIITETGLFITALALSRIYADDIMVSPTKTAIVDNLTGAGFFIAFATSLTTTVLIAYRIYLVLNQEGVSRRRFKNLLDIVVQSGALYSFTLLVAAISYVVPGSTVINKQAIVLRGLQDYADSLTLTVPGISVTILVARVALLAPNTTYSSSSVQISGLQFHGRSDYQTGIQEEAEPTRFMNIHRSSDEEAQEAGAKVQ